MLTKNKFDNSTPRQQIIMKMEPPRKLCINTISLEPTQPLSNDVFEISKLTVPESGEYSVNLQVVFQQAHNRGVKLNFFQFGICETLEQSEDNFKSTIVNAVIEPEYIISDSLSTIMHLDAEKSYKIWLNMSSSNNTNFQFKAEYSHCKLYKLA